MRLSGRHNCGLHPRKRFRTLERVDGFLFLLCFQNEIKVGRTLTDPKDASPVVTMMRLSPAEVLTLGEEGVVKVWDTAKGKVLAKVGGKNNAFYSVVQKTGDCSFWAASAKSVTAFSYKKKKITADLTRDVGRTVTSMLRVQNVVWIGDGDGGLSRWNMQTAQPIGQRIREQGRAVHALQKVETTANKGGFSSASRYVWAAARDCTICIYSEDLVLLRKITVGTSLPVTEVILADSYVATSSEDHNVVLWSKELPAEGSPSSPNGADMLVERMPALHKDAVNSICYAEDVEQLWCAASDRVIAVWNRTLKKGKLAPERSGSSLASAGTPRMAESLEPTRSSSSSALHVVGSVPKTTSSPNLLAKVPAREVNSAPADAGAERQAVSGGAASKRKKSRGESTTSVTMESE